MKKVRSFVPAAACLLSLCGYAAQAQSTENEDAAMLQLQSGCKGVTDTAGEEL